MRLLISRLSYLTVIAATLLNVGCGGSSDNVTSSGTSTLSGTIFIDTRSDIDDDTVTPSGLVELNNQVSTAQNLSNPVILGGYLSGTSGSYSNNKPYDKDAKDFYRVTLRKDQQISVTTFLADDDLAVIDMSVSLYLAGEELNDPITDPLEFDTPNSQSLTVPSDGDYTIEFSAQNDTSAPALYTLAISNTLSINTSSKTEPKESAPFVPGEIIVKLKEPKQFNTSNSKRVTKQSLITNLENTYQMQHKNHIGQLGSVFKLNSKAIKNSLSLEEKLAGTAQAETLNLKWQTLQAIEQLTVNDAVLYAEPNYILTASAIPVKVNDGLFNQQWNLSMISAPAAWDASTGEGVTVAVIDTGIDFNHLDLMNNINTEDGYDFILDDNAAADETSGSDDDPTDTGTFFHGTHVSGIIAARGNNGIGIAGVAYNTSIMPLRALGVENKGTNSDIASAILYAAKLTNSTGQVPTNKADIINMSLGGSAKSALLESAVNQALAQDIIIIAAAGNESSTSPHYPAGFDGVIAVSSVNEQKALSNFSNRGDFIDVTAPGGTSVNNTLYDGFQDGILGTLYASEYVEYTGTSMAAPHVSGVAALMKAIKADLTNENFEDALNSGVLTDDLIVENYYGNGLINAAKAVNWALEAEGESLLPPSLGIYPTRLGFINANTAATLELSNPGTGDVTVDISSADDWIEINESLANVTTGLGKYPIKVNNISLGPNDTNDGEITIQYTLDGETQEPLIINVFNENSQLSESDVGSLFVSLSSVDENSPKQPLVQFSIVEALKGTNQYTYTFYNVPDGNYLLQAGTNNDNDANLIDTGEARGQYPLLTQPEFIEVKNQNITNLDFSVLFQTFSEASASQIPLASSNKSIGSTLKFR